MSVQCKKTAWLVALVTSLAVFAMPAMAATTLSVSGILAWFAGPSMEAGAGEFLKSHPDVELSFVGASPEDVIVRIIGGAPPDLVGLPPSMLAQWAEQDLILPLTPLIARDGVNASEFIPPVWESVTYKGDVWGMPLIVDPNFALVYNKRLFAEAGLDPNSPPQTIEELDQIFSRLIRYGADGELTQVPIIPWDVYGPTNTLLTWGWAFGAEFVDPDTGELVLDHPQAVAALEWMDRYYQQYAADVNALLAKNDDSAIPLFINEQLAMYVTHSGGANEIMATRPDLEMGIAVMPHAPGVPNPTWIGGWALVIPKGAPNPELAWEFAKALTATPEGTTGFATHAGWFTGYIPSGSWEEFMQHPVLGPYVDIVLNAGRARPSIPVYHSFEQETDLAVVDLFERREFSARDVLARIARRVDQEMARLFESQ